MKNICLCALLLENLTFVWPKYEVVKTYILIYNDSVMMQFERTNEFYANIGNLTSFVILIKS